MLVVAVCKSRNTNGATHLITAYLFYRGFIFTIDMSSTQYSTLFMVKCRLVRHDKILLFFFFSSLCWRLKMAQAKGQLWQPLWLHDSGRRRLDSEGKERGNVRDRDRQNEVWRERESGGRKEGDIREGWGNGTQKASRKETQRSRKERKLYSLLLF